MIATLWVYILYFSLICWLYCSLCQKLAHVFILRCNLEVESYQVLLVRKHELWSHSTIAVRQRQLDICSEQWWVNLLMVFLGSLISSQSLAIMVIAQQRILEAFAALDRVGDRRSSDQKAVVFHTWQALELLETASEQVLMRLWDFRSELEEHCDISAPISAKDKAYGHIPMWTMVIFAYCWVVYTIYCDLEWYHEKRSCSSWERYS